MGYYMFAYGVNTSELQATFASKDETLLAEVQKNEMPTLPLEVIEGIEQGWQELREGKGIASADVHKKARILCAGR